MKRFPAKRTFIARPSAYKPRNAQYDKLSETRWQAAPSSSLVNSREFLGQIAKNQNGSQPRTGVETRQGRRRDRGTRKSSRVRNTEGEAYDCSIQILPTGSCEN